MVHLPVCQTPAGQSECSGAAVRSPMEMVVHTPVMLQQSLKQFCCRVSNTKYEISWPNAFLRPLSWPTSRWHMWCPVASARWPQLPSCIWHPPTSSTWYDWQTRGGIGEWCWDEVPESRILPANEQRILKVWRDTSIEDYPTAGIPWSHPELCAWLFCRLRANGCWWRVCSMATRAQSHGESSRSALLAP